jgi:hypothetical protein
MHLQSVPHTVNQPAAQTGEASSPRGDIEWISFEVTLWLPQSWQNPNAIPSSCVQER